MSKFTKIIALVMCALMLTMALTGCSTKLDVDTIKSQGKIVMATSSGFPPFEYIAGGECVGVDVDIANEIAKDLGVTLEVQDMDFDSIIGAVKSGKVAMGVAGLSITEDRLQNVDFTIEYVNSKLFIIVKADNTDITGADSLSGKSIGVQTGTTSDTFASGVEGAEVLRYKTFLEAATAVSTGKVNCMIVDELTAKEILAANKDLKQLEEPFADENYAIAVQKGNQTLLDAINATLQRLKDEGKIEEYIYNHATAEAAE